MGEIAKVEFFVGLNAEITITTRMKPLPKCFFYVMATILFKIQGRAYFSGSISCGQLLIRPLDMRSLRLRSSPHLPILSTCEYMDCSQDSVLESPDQSGNAIGSGTQ